MSGPELLEEFDDLLALGYDVGDVLLATGRGYEAARQVAKRAGRMDLVEVLSEWKKGDADRLMRARGLTWK
jgi:hypothetical protein